VPYELDNAAVLVAWMERTSDSVLWAHVLDWVGVLLSNPDGIEATAVPGRPGVVATFVAGTDVAAAYLVSDEYRTVRLLSLMGIDELP
jgi:hypothetical protein